MSRGSQLTLRDDVQRAAARVDARFAERAAEPHAPSAAYGLFTSEGLVHTGSTGLVDGALPTADTVYRIASCTKSFTVTALLALRDAGEVTLDAPITDFVPAFADVRLPTPDSPVPTLRMLMTMSGGLPTDDPWGDRQESLSDEAFDALVSRGFRFDSIPGTRFAYSNLGYALLGRAIQVVAGRPFREVVEQTILTPLGLNSTTFAVPSRATSSVAFGHRRLGDSWEGLPFSRPGAFSSIGGLFSTVADLSRWARWLSAAWLDEAAGGAASAAATPEFLGEGGAGHDDGVLSRSSRREMAQLHRFAPAIVAQPTGYGFGLFVEQQPGLGPMVSHSGGYPGFSAHMRWQRSSGIGIVAFENATYAQVAAPASASVHELLHDVAAYPEVSVWPETLAARILTETILGGAELPSTMVSENVARDIPWSTRRALWAEAATEVGVDLDALPRRAVPAPTPTGQNVPIDSGAGEESQAPSHLVWRVPGRAGRLRIEIRLTPEASPRIQTLTVRAEPAR